MELLVSPPGTGKTAYCVEIFRKQILKTKSGIESRSFFILPSREHAERIRNLILKTGVPGLFNAHLGTINDLTARLAGFQTDPGPSDPVRRGLILRILEEHGESFASWRGVRTSRGFRHLLADALREFRQSLLTLPEFEKRCQPLLRDAAFRAKFRDFTVFLKLYDRELKARGLREPEENLTRLLREKRGALGADLVIFDGFYHFTRAQKELVRALAAGSGRTVVTLTLPEDAERQKGLFEYPERTRAFLKSCGFREKKGAFSLNRRTRVGALLHLERNLFRKKPQAYAGSDSGALEIIEAGHVRGEAEIIAREIKRLYNTADFHYSDFCVILRSIKGYEGVLSSAFRELGIPVHIHERRRLISESIAQALSRFLNLSLEDWKREDLFSFLKYSLANVSVKAEDVFSLESLANRLNVSGGRENWEKVLAEEKGESGARRLLAPVMRWTDRIRSAESPDHFCAGVRAVLDHLAADRPPEDPVRDRVDQLLEGVCSSSGAAMKSFSPTGLARNLQESLEEALFSVRPRGRNRVQVYDVVMSLPKEYRVVFLAGLLEKRFPQQVTEDPLFKDPERRRINGSEIFLEERVWRLAGERYFFYMAATRAKEKLFFSYPLYDTEGRPSLPSFFVEEVRKCFPEIRLRRKTIEDVLPAPSEWADPSDVERGLAETLRQRSRVPADYSPEDRALWLAGFNAVACSAEKRRALLEYFEDRDVRIRDRRILKIFREDRIFSATRFDFFATCAFKHFARYTLRLNEPLEGRESLEAGNVLHRALETAFGEISSQAGFEKILAEGPRALAQKFSDHLDGAFARSAFMREPFYRRKAVLESLRRGLALFAGQEAEIYKKRGWIPTYFEMSFGRPKTGRFVLGEGRKDSAVIVQGVIDRVDLSADKKSAFVIDYKLSSAGRPKIRVKVEQGTEFQLPLYALAVQKRLGLPVKGCELRFIRNPKNPDGLYEESAADGLSRSQKSRAMTAGEWRDFLEDAEDRALEAAARFRSGDITVRSKSCEHCGFNAVCRFEPWKLIYAEKT